MKATLESPKNYAVEISNSGHTIYTPIQVGDPNLWIPSPALEDLLNAGLQGISLQGLALRTRSKLVKEKICAILGYPIPKSFKRTQPRFPGQYFDTYVQKSNNLQIWNEEISPTRRYVLIRVSDADIVQKVKVITGEELALLDTTGTLTKKYQARLTLGTATTELVSDEDTDVLRRLFLQTAFPTTFTVSPTTYPEPTALLPVAIIYERLSALIGRSFSAVGFTQERNRGGELHKLVCNSLGYTTYQDDGRFPDIRHQLVEVKLQTSTTIDLGLVRPDSTDLLDVPQVSGHQIRHCDVRYAIFYAARNGTTVTLTHFFLTTGQGFFGRFSQFQGKVLNAKLQIPLPASFFD